MNQTGVRSTGSRRHALTSSGSTTPTLAPLWSTTFPQAHSQCAGCRSTCRCCRPELSPKCMPRSRTRAQLRGATSTSPTTGSTSAAIRSTGTGCARRSARRPANVAKSTHGSARRSRRAATCWPSISSASTASGSRSSATTRRCARSTSSRARRRRRAHSSTATPNGRPIGISAFAPRTRRGMRPSAARSASAEASFGARLPSSRRTRRTVDATPRSRIHSSVRRCYRRSNRTPRSPACPRGVPRETSRGSSTRVNTNAPSASAAIAATTR